MERIDRISIVAALALVAGIVGFVVATGDVGADGAYYYRSIAPEPSVNELVREFAVPGGRSKHESGSMNVLDTQPAASEPKTPAGSAANS